MARYSNSSIEQLFFSVFICWCYCCCCCCCFFGIGVATAQEEVGCSTGTVQDDCVSASEGDEFFFCTDRYSWEWSQDVQQLPTQASDSLCLTMDSNVIPDLEQTEVLVLGGCDAVSQNISGSCGSLSNSTRSFDPLLDRFEEKQVMPTERFRAAAVNASEYVYLFGGRDLNGSLTCNVDRYNVLTGEWVELDAVQEAHCHSDHAGVASGNDTIYLFGGYTEDYSAQSTVVKVEISGDDEFSFSTVAPMGIARGDHACVGLPARAEVLCIGGFTEADFEYTILRSVERFDFETEQWEDKADMVNPRADFGAGMLNGRLTVVGGEDDDRKPMDDMEWYDPEEDCWTDSGELFDLPFKRLRYCLATIRTDQRIYIFGGQAADEVSDEVYAIKDTVNWYQEFLVDELSPSAAAPSYQTATAFVVTIAIGVTSACLLAFTPHF